MSAIDILHTEALVDYDNIFDSKLDKLKQGGNYREFSPLERNVSRGTTAENAGKPLTIWCNNDYLGMSQHEAVINALVETAQKSGAGAGGTRNIAGTSKEIDLLEQSLAEIHNKEAALVFSSGYAANSTILNTIASNLPDCVIFSDEKNHASMIEGIRYAKAEKIIFKHNNIADLRTKLLATPANKSKLIAFESVYSMDGDFGRIKEIVKLAKEFNALTYLDEVHAVGLYGNSGQGVAEQLGLADQVDIIQGTFGKAYGVIGGFIVGKNNLIDFTRSYAPGLIFTTAMPPSTAAACRASLEYVAKTPELQAQFHNRVNHIKAKLQELNIPLMPSCESHILPIFVGSADKAKEISNRLRNEFGLFLQHINSPTVPVGTERLRLTPTPLHTEEQIDYLFNCLKKVF